MQTLPPSDKIFTILYNVKLAKIGTVIQSKYLEMSSCYLEDNEDGLVILIHTPLAM